MLRRKGRFPRCGGGRRMKTLFMQYLPEQHLFDELSLGHPRHRRAFILSTPVIRSRINNYVDMCCRDGARQACV
ncbi:hypothetical protein C2845_PM18G08820 [Panicum miliaceum]|uniref:Uncharacterized protein n=1 Tax=Panicum miliaceum TaxID=4540 RepID=A0A3L6PHB7_PANMI|nr:hypothetical protein C2845_PM18G08820 [Panicum miliaceum]